MGKINKKNKDTQKESLIRAQDLKIIKALAGNDKKLREKVLKNLKKWFEQRSSKIPFTKEDFVRFWKGLFTTMWMSDKPLVQEECAEKIAHLIHFSTNPQTALLFFRSGIIVLTKEWFGIDQLRLDKFLMLVRRVLRQAFEVLKEYKWDHALVVEFGNIMFETVLKTENSTCLGLTMHITEIYLEELAKVSNGEIEEHLVTEFIKPFIKQLVKLTDDRQINHMKKFMFHHLLNQSDEGIEYQVKFEAWKERGFPGGTIDALERIEAADDISDEEDEEQNDRPLDPRAGHVDVLLPQLRFDPIEISQLLLDHKFSEGSTTKARKTIVKLANEFKQLSKEIFPLGMKEIRVPDDPSYSTNLRKSVNRLVKFEKKLLSNSNKNRRRKLKRKIDENEENEDENETSEDKLQEFIKKSERNLMNGNVTKKRKLMAKTEKNVKILKNKPGLRTDKKNIVTTASKSTIKSKRSFEESFQRNSGTWFVELLDSDESFVDKTLQSTENSPRKRRSLQELYKSKESVSNDRSFRKKRLSNGETPPQESLISSPNTRQAKLNRNHTNHSTPKLKNKTLFPQIEWDSPAKEGEVEIVVPSNKYKEKMKKLAKKTNKTVEQLIDDAVNGRSKRYSLNIADKFDNNKKKRLSLDSNIVKNPFAKVGITPKSEKKVKIVLKMNKSQEIHEHMTQLRNSPAIPYDANKKPSKPLLKPTAVASPINPFYRRKLKLL